MFVFLTLTLGYCSKDSYDPNDILAMKDFVYAVLNIAFAIYTSKNKKSG